MPSFTFSDIARRLSLSLDDLEGYNILNVPVDDDACLDCRLGGSAIYVTDMVLTTVQSRDEHISGISNYHDTIHVFSYTLTSAARVLIGEFEDLFVLGSSSLNRSSSSGRDSSIATRLMIPRAVSLFSR